MANEDNLIPITDTETAKELGSKGGKAKKGSKHISTWIQDMLNDEEFETTLIDSKKGQVEYKGAPLKAIIKTAMHKAIHDKDKGQQWAEWLAKHGYGTKQIIEISDPRKEILDKYIGGDNAREAEETQS